MLQVAEFWVALAFIIFVAIAFKPARKAILSMLDDRAERIRGELEEAQRLREEAQSLLAGYQRRQRDALKEAEAIVAHAREEADRLRTSAAAELESSMRRREAQAMDKIAQAETAAVQEVRNLTVDIAISASGRILAQRLDDGQSARLVDEAIKDLPKHLN
jgi:F-type H+-transporting ATPase subunit b